MSQSVIIDIMHFNMLKILFCFYEIKIHKNVILNKLNVNGKVFVSWQSTCVFL